MAIDTLINDLIEQVGTSLLAEDAFTDVIEQLAQEGVEGAIFDAVGPLELRIEELEAEIAQLTKTIDESLVNLVSKVPAAKPVAAGCIYVLAGTYLLADGTWESDITKAHVFYP